MKNMTDAHIQIPSSVDNNLVKLFDFLASKNIGMQCNNPSNIVMTIKYELFKPPNNKNRYFSKKN